MRLVLHTARKSPSPTLFIHEPHPAKILKPYQVRDANKPFKGSLSVRLRDGLHTKAAIFAERNDVKINTVINDALDEYLAKSF